VIPSAYQLDRIENETPYTLAVISVNKFQMVRALGDELAHKAVCRRLLGAFVGARAFTFATGFVAFHRFSNGGDRISTAMFADFGLLTRKRKESWNQTSFLDPRRTYVCLVFRLKFTNPKMQLRGTDQQVSLAPLFWGLFCHGARYSNCMLEVLQQSQPTRGNANLIFRAHYRWARIPGEMTIVIALAFDQQT